MPQLEFEEKVKKTENWGKKVKIRKHFSFFVANFMTLGRGGGVEGNTIMLGVRKKLNTSTL